MAAVNGPHPGTSGAGGFSVVPWTCPHCQATWHSGRQYCVDCGYGVTASAGASTEARVEELRREAGAGAEYARYEAERRQQVETNEAALRRSLEAESALQAEVALLRERTSQLQMRLDEQRRVFVTGVKQMMQPLQDYFQAQHLEVPFEALVPQALEQLQSLTSTVAGLHEGAQTLRRSVEARRVAPDATQIRELSSAIAQLTQRIDRLEVLASEVEAQIPAAARRYGAESPESYDTFVMSDRQSAEIERALLDAQTRGRSFPG